MSLGLLMHLTSWSVRGDFSLLQKSPDRFWGRTSFPFSTYRGSLPDAKQ